MEDTCHVINNEIVVKTDWNPNDKENMASNNVDGASTSTVRDPNRDQGRLPLGKSEGNYGGHGPNLFEDHYQASQEDQLAGKKHCSDTNRFGMSKLIC